MNFKNIDDLIKKLSTKDKKESTKELTKFYAEARFKIDKDTFNRQYVDGKYDGGIDFYHSDDDAFFILQTKFVTQSKLASETEILEEINKLKNTLSGQNQNKRAEEFVNAIKRQIQDKQAIVEIVFVTTSKISHALQNKIQKNINDWKKQKGWQIDIDFVSKDYFGLDTTLYDIEHGFVPQTGKRVLTLEKGQWIENDSDKTSVYSITCTVKVNDLLSWFSSSDDIRQALQKNVREFIGDTGKINQKIGESYQLTPDWFWYKHNGVIIFADNITIDKNKNQLILRNPQIVNGGQTLSTLFATYDKMDRADNTSKILLRAYRVPYDYAGTYKTSIDIISALNSQNKIDPSDLRSTDPRQVRLERLFREKLAYEYHRKRSKDAKSSTHSITMKNLALIYYVCKKNSSRDGVIGKIEEIFDDDIKYDEAFDENLINKELKDSLDHIVIDYATVWNLYHSLKRMKRDLPKKVQDVFKFTKWYVLPDIYSELKKWQGGKSLTPLRYLEFLSSVYFRTSVEKYGRDVFCFATSILPRNEEAINYYKTKNAEEGFFSRKRTKDFVTLIEKSYKKWQKDN